MLVWLQRAGRTLAVSGISGDHDLRLGIVDAVAKRLGREAAEHDRVRRADAGAGKQRDCGLGDHGQVDRDTVTTADTQAPERRSEALHFVEQLGVGDRASVTRLALEVERHAVAEPRGDVTVEAVDAHVQLAVFEPLGERQVPLEHLREGLRPGHQIAGLTSPERLPVGVGLVLQGAVTDEGCGDERRRRRERPILL